MIKMQGIQLMNTYDLDRGQIFDQSKKKVSEIPKNDQIQNQTAYINT
jgi:hypothetical protein